MAKVETGCSFELTCRCRGCQLSASIDELHDAKAKRVRSLKVDRVSVHELECPALPCPRCGSTAYAIRFGTQG